MRYCPERELPEYAFRPGQSVHPNKEGGHSFNCPEVISNKLEITNQDFLYSIDLFNHKYFWEAHVYLEAIWNAHNRVGVEADFCKGLIKLSAGSLKRELNQDQSAIDHFNRAKELFSNLSDSPIRELSLERIDSYIFKLINLEDTEIELEF